MILSNELVVYRARRPLESDADALAKARKEASGEIPEKKKVKAFNGSGGKREMATDDQVSSLLFLLLHPIKLNVIRAIDKFSSY